MNSTDVVEPQTLTQPAGCRSDSADTTTGHGDFRRVGIRCTSSTLRAATSSTEQGSVTWIFRRSSCASNLGHKNQAVIDVDREAGPGVWLTRCRAMRRRPGLSCRSFLLEVLPKGFSKFFFTTSGTEANEAAFKIARMYTGKTKIIARYRSYHGSTAGSIAATGDPRRWAMEPRGKGPGIIFAPEVHCYKCPIRHTYPGCGIACADYLEHMIRNESDVAAVLVEPIVGTNGVIVPPTSTCQSFAGYAINMACC